MLKQTFRLVHYTLGLLLGIGGVGWVVQAAPTPSSSPNGKPAATPAAASQPVSAAASPTSQPAVKHELQISLVNTFAVSDTDRWKVEVQRQMPLRSAEVHVLPKAGAAFDMMLYFKCDTPDLAQFDSLEKIERSLRKSSEKYLPNAVEKTLTIKHLDPKGWYGLYTVLTDAETAKLENVPEGEFKYITRGMIRLSKDDALGFSLMTNEVDTPAYKELLDYIVSFAKEKDKY